MILEEAIKHCEEVADYKDHDAELWDRSAEFWKEDNKYAVDQVKECRRCAEEHRQLAEWLKLLQRILSSGECNNCAMLHSQCRYAPRCGEQVRYNCPFYHAEREESE